MMKKYICVIALRKRASSLKHARLPRFFDDHRFLEKATLTVSMQRILDNA